MNKIKCHFFHVSTKVKRYFRRYEDGNCPGSSKTYHNAQKLRDEVNVPIPTDGDESHPYMVCKKPAVRLREYFPDNCDYCDYRFTAQSEFQLNNERQYQNTETKEYFGLHELPIGGMYFAPWLDDWTEPQLEHVLIVRTPGGLWTIDSQASNCTNPAKDGIKRQSDHHCWIIEGTEPPNLTVSKNGNTCGAGGGSIQCGSYHGFLRNGYLEEC